MAEIYEHKMQYKQISKTVKREIHELEDLIHSFEKQLDSYKNSSLPLSLIHENKRNCETFSDLPNYIVEFEGDFAIYLVTNNHVVAIYRIDDNSAYFDSNTAFISRLKRVDQLMKG